MVGVVSYPIRVAGKIGEGRAVDPLTAVLHQDSDSDVREAAAVLY